MKFLKFYLQETWRLIRSPKSEFEKPTHYSGYFEIYIRALLPILAGYLFSHLSFKALALEYVFLGGSIGRFIFQLILPSLLVGTFYAILYAALYLLLAGGIFYGVGKFFSGRAEIDFSLGLASKIAFLVPIWGLLVLFDFTRVFGFIIYLIFFIYATYLIILSLFYGVRVSKNTSIIGGLALGLVLYGFFFFHDDRQMDNLIIPTQPKLMTPEEEQEKIQEAQEIIRKLEDARRAKGYND
ncbi:hypothetical protein EHQ53_15295 [Leptospira langatensis]|uniref:YIP1 family protein n=1 Tax=Leptospira langatensis TaxID=2484983 RepID=A0A5F1ZQ50_9LEPT|nr:hypothetical protein [Leptospira langatensis]TGK01835.1 hypothetical protein EHO57_08535 [Leptospira langatensis]TGL39440.1 hypothetical protein EHQ53_15295 [Leptospira langatensis]